MTRGYVAVNFSFDSRTDKVECVARQDMVITGENGASVSLSKGEKFTAVRAGSLGKNMWYIVRRVSGAKKCSCPAAKPCVHEIHVATGRPLAELRAEVEARAEARKSAKSRKSKVSQVVAEKVAEASQLATTGTVVNHVASKIAKSNEQTTVQRNSSEKMLNASLTKNVGFCLMR